jgi:hypothetical protein
MAAEIQPINLYVINFIVRQNWCIEIKSYNIKFDETYDQF